MRLVALLLLAAACRPERVPEGTSVLFDPTLPDIALVRDGDVLLRLPADGLALGAVEEHDETLSYDPWFEDRVDATWLAWVAAEPDENPGDALIAAWLVFENDVRAHLRVDEEGEGRFAARLEPDDDAPPLAFYRLDAVVDAEEGFYGIGEVPDTPNHRGMRRAIQLEADLSVESANNESHVGVPFLIGTTGWGLLVEDLHPIVFDVATEADDRVAVTVGTGPDSAEGLRFHLFAAQHPLDVTKKYWETTGDAALPARWAYGPLQWRDDHANQAQVEADLDAMRDLDLPTNGVWIDYPYATGIETFDFHGERFPDPAAMIAKAHALGFRVSLWHVPYLDPQESPTLSAEFVSAGYFAPSQPPVFNDWGPLVDFTNPAAFARWQDLVRQYDAMGIEGYKLDYAEDVVLGVNGGRLAWEFSDGSDERTMHRRYSLLFHQAYAETLPSDGGFLLCRAGALGGQQYASVIWPGDLDATLNPHKALVEDDGVTYSATGGLPTALVFGLSLSAAGYPLYGSDTGGYRHSPPDKEVFTRWFEQTALSTVMQIGTSSNDVAWEPTPENGFDEEMLGWYRDYTRLHLRLFPYVWSYAVRMAEEGGRPIQRPYGLAWPETGLHPADTYMLGDHLLVAPVVTYGQRTRDVPFPPGTWVDWFTGERFEGPATITVDAPLQKLPLYIAEGGVVPMLRPTIDTLAPTTEPTRVDSYTTDAGLVWIRAVPGPAAAFVLFDGGAITTLEMSNRWALRYEPGDELDGGAMLELLSAVHPPVVLLDGSPLTHYLDPAALPAEEEGWSWSEDAGGTAWVRVPEGDHTVTVVFAYE